MAKIGYMRVSKGDQNSNLQRDFLEQAGCQEIFADEGISGTSKQREGLFKALETLKAGDTLTAWKLDRLGRSTIHLLQLLDELREREIAFHSITEDIDTGTASGRMVFSMIAAMAELERKNLREHTKAGLSSAKRRGVKLGRPKAMSKEQIKHAKSLQSSGMRKADIARKMGMKYSTLSGLLKP